MSLDKNSIKSTFVYQGGKWVKDENFFGNDAQDDDDDGSILSDNSEEQYFPTDKVFDAFVSEQSEKFVELADSLKQCYKVIGHYRTRARQIRKQMHNERNTVLNRIAVELDESRAQKKRQHDEHVDDGDEDDDDKQKKISKKNSSHKSATKKKK